MLSPYFICCENLYHDDGGANDPFRGMVGRENPQRPNIRATPQGLDQRSKLERESPK